MSAMVGAGQMHNGTKNHAARAATGRSCVLRYLSIGGNITWCGGRGNVFLAREGRPVVDLDMGGTLADIAREIGDSGLRGREVGNHGARFRRGDARGIAAQVWGRTDQN